MTDTVFVTDAQVKAAQMLVARDVARGRPPDQATLRIAGAHEELPVRSGPASPGAPPLASVSFWDALDPAEREALGSASSWLTFPAGKTLMWQGEIAKEVIVILGGRVKISVNRDGRENVLAVRGLGQLVGESAVFRPGVRSATVAALEMVWALVLTGEDFLAFIESHPRVRRVLYAQLNDRLVEEPATFFDRAANRGPIDDEPEDEHLHRHLTSRTGEKRAVVLSDVARFGTRSPDGLRPVRDAPIRDALDSALAEVLPGVPGMRTLDRGDGSLTVLPPGVSTAEVTGPLLKALPAAIARRTANRDGSAQLPLRLAVNIGPVSSEAAEFSGEGIDLAAPLLEARPVEKAVADGAILAVVISPFVFETVIRPGPDLDEIAGYTQIPVEIGESSTTAWMKVISGDPIAENVQS